MFIKSIQKLLALFLLVILIPEVSDCMGGDRTMNELSSNCNKELIFQEVMFGIPIETYFKINVDLKNSDFELKKDILINNYGPSYDEIPRDYINKIHAELDPEKIISIIDVSPDKNWLSLLYKDKYTTLGNGNIIFTNVGYLINVKRQIYNKLPQLSACYFSSDSKSCFFRDGWELYRLDLKSGDRFKICDTTDFFINKTKSKLILFFDGKIHMLNLESTTDLPIEIGQYKNIVVSSGILCKEWAYFITQSSPKTGEAKLFFINLASKIVQKLPFKIPTASLLYIQGVQ